MSSWAEINNNNIVIRVIAGDNNLPDEGYQWLIDNLGGTWIKTSYNTHGGINNREGGVALNKNYAGIGYTWDGTGFAAPQPYLSWIKDSETYLWNSPIPKPEGLGWIWDEPTLNWVESPTL